MIDTTGKNILGNVIHVLHSGGTFTARIGIEDKPGIDVRRLALAKAFDLVKVQGHEPHGAYCADHLTEAQSHAVTRSSLARR